jgi:hypothetical protein
MRSITNPCGYYFWKYRANGESQTALKFAAI